MLKVLALTLRALGILRFDFLAKRKEAFPDETSAQPGELTIVSSGDIDKWACLLCPGGCGRQIALSLNPSRRPRWSVTLGLWKRPTIEPSVHQLNDCGCHFWIRNGVIDWCEGGRPHRTS